jgi:chromosomal replication initiator protein
LRDTELVGYREGVFEVGAQNSYARDWLDDRLTSTVGRVLTGIVGHQMEVMFVVV